MENHDRAELERDLRLNEPTFAILIINIVVYINTTFLGGEDIIATCFGMDY